MRRVSVLLTLLLVASLLAVVGSHPVDAAGNRALVSKTATSVSLRLAPDHVTVFDNGVREPTGLVAQVAPAQVGRTVTFQQRSGSTWRTLARTSTDATGRAYRPLASPTAAGAWSYRVAVAGTTSFKPAVSVARTLTANLNTDCRPSTAPVDSAATGEVYCLLARLDRWRANGLMGIGQQVNISRYQDWDVPLRGISPAVVGFDLEELDQAATAEFPYASTNIQGLLDRAKAGAVLVASWHAKNPFTDPPQPYNSARQSLGVLVAATPRTPAQQVVYDRFWADWTAKLALLKRFQDGDSDGTVDSGTVDGERTAVVVRPFHEVNGDFFWWGQPTPATYRKLWDEMQSRAAAAGVHNIVWAYSGNRRTVSTKDPAAYVPSRVDVGALDTYDPEIGRGNTPDVLGLEGYAAIDQVPGVNRMALTEVGPHGSKDGSWNPTVITTTLRKARVSPLWAMLWFDDGVPSASDTASGKKQIGSLTGGRAWLRSCFNSLCYLR